MLSLESAHINVLYVWQEIAVTRVRCDNAAGKQERSTSKPEQEYLQIVDSADFIEPPA